MGVKPSNSLPKDLDAVAFEQESMQEPLHRRLRGLFVSAEDILDRVSRMIDPRRADLGLDI